MSSITYRKCRICDIMFKVKYTSHKFSCMTLEEGFNYENNWFCNKCWKELNKDIFINKDLRKRKLPKKIVGKDNYIIGNFSKK